MEKRYAIDVEADVLRDNINNLVANFMRYVIENNINRREDKENPVVIKYEETYRLMESTYRMKEYEEIDAAQKKLDELWRFYNGIL